MPTAVTPTPREFKLNHLTSRQGIRSISRRLLDCRRCGLEDKFVLHAWTIFLLFDSLGKFILFNTNLFGHYTIRKGLLSIYSVVYMSIAIAALYMWYLLDE